MTIARTGNKILDDSAFAKAKAQTEEQRAKAAAKKAASRSRTTTQARAGRRAIANSKGRGVSASAHKNRRAAKISIHYAVGKPNSRLLVSNAGLKVNDIFSCFRLAQSSRPDIEKHTGHISFSIPPRKSLSDLEWIALIDLVRSEFGLDDAFPFVVGLHTDTGHQHVHLMYSRVSYDGRVFDDRFSKLRLAAIEDVVERKCGLQITPKEDFVLAPKFHLKEAAMAARTGVQPPRFIILDTIKSVLATSPASPAEFIYKLHEMGVMARPAIKKKKMSGFSFQLHGIEFSASKISNKFGWKKLMKEIGYDPNRDDQTLADYAATLPAKPRTKIPGADDALEPADRKTQNPQRGAEHRPEEESAANRRTLEPKAVAVRAGSRPADRLRELRNLALLRKFKFDYIRKALAHDKSQIARRFCKALDPIKNEKDIAREFMRGKNGGRQAVELIKLLSLPASLHEEIIQPYTERLKAELAYEKRMASAAVNDASPGQDDSPTFMKTH